MRIALFHNTPSGGAKRAIHEWTQRLALRHQLDVYTLSSADHAFCDLRPFVQNHHIVDFAPKHLFNSPFGRLNQWQRRRDLDELVRIGQTIAHEINTGNYDLLFANTCQYTFIPTFLPWVTIPTVYYLHEPFGRKFIRQLARPYWRDSGWRRWIDRADPLIALYQRRLDQIQRASVRQTNRLLANSCFTKAQTKVNFGIDTPVCYTGVNAKQFQPLAGVTKEDFVISVGELSPRKGFDFVIESIGHIPAPQRPRLKIVGNMVQAAERSYLEALAEQWDVNLEISIGLTADELAVAFNQARLCVYAPVLEPFGLVALEAMACGLPVVGVQEGGVAESVVHEQTGLLVERTPQLFAEAMQQLLLNPALAATYGQNARHHVLEQWTWEHSTAALEEQFICSRDE